MTPGIPPLSKPTRLDSLLCELHSASELGVNLSGLLVGGAILGVIVASASQASLGNFFSGL